MTDEAVWRQYGVRGRTYAEGRVKEKVLGLLVRIYHSPVGVVEHHAGGNRLVQDAVALLTAPQGLLHVEAVDRGGG